MQQNNLQQFCKISLAKLFELAYDCQVRVVGSIKQIFQHKKYIVEVYIGKQLTIRCLKRYSEFQALFEVIRMNFKNIDLNIGQFPSKYQVVNREQTRRHYFQILLNKIVEIYCEKITNQTNRRLMSTIYVFMIGEQDYKPRKQSDASFEAESVYSKKQELQNMKINVISESDAFQKKNSYKKMQELTFLKSHTSQDPENVDYQAKFRAFISSEFLICFQGEDEWKQRYLKIENSCLLIYKHKNDNHFKTKIELYQAKIEYLHRDKNLFDHFCEKMELNNEPTFRNDTTILAISHQYDYKKLLIKAKQDEKISLEMAKQLIVKASHQTSNCGNIQGVFSPIGKLFIIFHKIYFEENSKKNSPIIHLRINASGLTYETKRMTYSSNSALNIKQGFIIPISNAFANIIIEVMMVENDGIIRHQTQQKCTGRYRLCFSDFIAYPSGHGVQKIKARTGLQPHESVKYQALIELSVMNYSHFSSIYADSYANENDGIIMEGLKSMQDTQLLVITVDRVLRIIGNVALFITAFWRNVYLFKYPRMGYSFFVTILMIFIFGNAGLIFYLLISLVIFAMVFNIPTCKRLIKQLLDDYVFKYKHENHKQPLCIDTNQLKFMKWTYNLEMMKIDYRLTLNGKLQKRQQAKDKKFEYWQLKVHDKVFKIKEDLPSLLEKVYEVKKIIELVLRMISAVINIVEKVCNVLCWADPRKSIIIFCILVFISNVANHYILRTIGVIFCIHRLIKALNFYKIKHYNNNRKLAIYCIRYIINKSFPGLLPNKQKKIQTTDQNQICQVLTEIFFPIRDEEKVKKMKEQIQFVLGVYIDSQELLKREEKKSEMRLYYLVEIIQSCQARLKLEWISGQEGISDGFQELKRLTSEQLVIDLWVQSLLINFFLNIPSQLYTTFRPIRSEVSLRCENARNRIGQYFIKLNV